MFLSSILAILKQALAGQIVNNQLNPLHLNIATTGYRIQSQTLKTPDRFGFFSPGPPRLQVHEGLYFLIMLGWIGLNVIFNAFSVFVCRLAGLSTCQKLGAAYALTMIPGVVLFWIGAVCDRRRAPGYEWGEWKVRTD